jgi:uncharacterized hydrophobic protein (TIGR00271 family)
MVLLLFNNLTGKDKSNAVEKLISASTPTQDFFFMVTLSIITATFGLLTNEVAVIIGSMLIAPMLYPILSLALGITISDPKLISRSFYTLLKAVLFAVFASALTSLLFVNHFSILTSEILARTQATLPNIIVAITAGFAGSFALVKPKLNETLPGIAISVALIPPLAVVGIGISKANWSVISGSLVLFLINTIGIIFASMITFSLMNFYVKRKKAQEVVKKEDEEVEKQKRKVEEEKIKEEAKKA